jgi:hypothetical protein
VIEGWGRSDFSTLHVESVFFLGGGKKEVFLLVQRFSV